jgi:hypothetical protein
LGSQNKGKVYPNKCFLEVRHVARVRVWGIMQGSLPSEPPSLPVLLIAVSQLTLRPDAVPNPPTMQAKCTSDVSPNTPHYSYVVAGNYLCTHPPTCFERKEALARCKQAWGAAGGGESNADCGCNLIEELLSKKLDSQCAATCMAKDGWNPVSRDCLACVEADRRSQPMLNLKLVPVCLQVCTANGLEAQGTLYPNKCFLEVRLAFARARV